MASITSIHLPTSRLTALRSLFGGRKFLKLLRRLTVDQAVPEIPLSVGSKLEPVYFSELLSLPNVCILPRTLTHLFAYAYCRVYTHVRVYYISYIQCIIHDRGAEGFAL